MKSSRQSKWVLGAAVILVFFLSFLGTGRGADAASSYKVKVNKQQNCVTIYKKNAAGKYKPIKAMVCSAGNDTPLGTYPLGEKLRWHTLMGPCYGQYCSRVTGGILFHSVWYSSYNNPSTLSVSSYNRLGTTASHGCIRLTVADAKWIYDNIPSGTPIVIYNSSNPGPLGKPTAIKLPYSTGWDPTDTGNSSNPWNSKKPSISGAKNQTVSYGASFQVKKGVTAKNTTGFDATGKIAVTVKYHGNTVKKVDTKNPGTYKVIYSLVDEIGRKAKSVVKVKVLAKLPKPKFQGVEDFTVTSKSQLTKARALKNVTVTQGGKTLAKKYITVKYKKIGKGVYRVIYKAQNASDVVRVTAKAYIKEKVKPTSGSAIDAGDTTSGSAIG
jgi:hypothetical protein